MEIGRPFHLFLSFDVVFEMTYYGFYHYSTSKLFPLLLFWIGRIAFPGIDSLVFHIGRLPPSPLFDQSRVLWELGLPWIHVVPTRVGWFCDHRGFKSTDSRDVPFLTSSGHPSYLMA